MGGLNLSDGRLMHDIEREVIRLTGLPITSLAIYRTNANDKFEFRLDFGYMGDVGYARTTTVSLPENEALFLGEAGIMNLVVQALREACTVVDK